jgi:hypothetical protein
MPLPVLPLAPPLKLPPRPPLNPPEPAPPVPLAPPLAPLAPTPSAPAPVVNLLSEADALHPTASARVSRSGRDEIWAYMETSLIEAVVGVYRGTS